MSSLRSIIIIIFLLCCFGYVSATENSTADLWAISYLESKLSTKGRNVKLEGVSGILDSHVHISKITISDAAGVWLIGQNLTLDWDRSQLFKDTLDISQLDVQSINILRKSTKENNFLEQFLNLSKLNLQSLPVNITIKKLTIHDVHYNKEVYGIDEHLNAHGFFIFKDYNLDSIIQLNGLNKNDNALLDVHYKHKTDRLNLDFSISESNGGLLSAILNLKNNDPIKLTLRGSGPTNNITIRLKSNIGDMQALHGFLTINKATILNNSEQKFNDSGQEIALRLEGPIKYIVPQTYKALFSKYSSLSGHAFIAPDHTIHITNFAIEGSALQANGSALILPDGFLRNLFLKAKLVSIMENKLPALGKLEIVYGDKNSNNWHASLNLHNRASNLLANINMFGIAENLDKADERHVTLNLDGFIKKNLNQLQIKSELDLHGNAPILLKDLTINNAENNIDISGMIENRTFRGYSSINIPNLHKISDFFNKSWQGKININGKTTIGLGKIAQDMDGTISSLKLDINNKITPFLKTNSILKGNLGYDFTYPQKITLNNFSIDNKDIAFNANGFLSYIDSDIFASLNHINLNLLDQHLEGSLNGNFVSKGHNGIIICAANLNSKAIFINKNKFNNVTIRGGGIVQKLNRIVPDYSGFLNIESEKHTLRLNIDDKYNLRFKARSVPLGLLQSFTKINLPLITFDGEGKIHDKQVTLNLTSQQKDIKLDIEALYNIKTKLLQSNIKGLANASLLHDWFAAKQMQAMGEVNFNLQANGSLKKPLINGSIATNNANFYDFKHDIKLKNINVFGKFTDNILHFTSASAQAEGSGNVVASGYIDATNVKNPIANLNFQLQDIPYAQGINFSALYSGDLKLTGEILHQPTLSGLITITKGTILISRNINSANPLEVQHKYITRPILTTLERAHIVAKKENKHKVANLLIDVEIKAPGQVFVKGMGLLVEMHGSVHVSGLSDNLHSIGSFKMINGHLSLLSHYFNFEKGDVTLNGDLKPFLSFIATTSTDKFTISVKLEGRTDDIKISFSSAPPLPQDEILAELLFQRSIKQLSAFQLAKIITTLSNLSGENNFFSILQNASTLENINIDTDEDGTIGLSAGKYITKNIYTSFGATQKGTTKASINWDLPHHFKATGQYHSDNQNNIGLYYNHDY